MSGIEYDQHRGFGRLATRVEFDVVDLDETPLAVLSYFDGLSVHGRELGRDTVEFSRVH